MATNNISFKEGFLKKKKAKSEVSFPGRSSWKSRFFILVESSLFYYESPTSEQEKGVIQLKGITIERVEQSLSKKKFTIVLKTIKKDIWLSAKSEESFNDWFIAFQQAIVKEAAEQSPERAKAKSLFYKAQKSMVEKAATSSVGKSVLKEYLPEDAWFMLSFLKSGITLFSNSNKAKQIENRLIKTGVKAVWLFKGGHLTPDEMQATCKQPILDLWTHFINCYEITKRDINLLSNLIRIVSNSFDQLLKRHVSPKNIEKMIQTFEYLADENFLNLIFSDNRLHNDLEKLIASLKLLKAVFLWVGN
eukprot:TRINITY_DN4533_c3_g1_i1.p1 TRINITY_DN4533_c3_g1~~TRINITY_DN4533_c3_g1_i1.p1  ORF type:complete len:305 (+),score=140.64 TRINITY_DN4533_c3_g1_i1:44-958(+)